MCWGVKTKNMQEKYFYLTSSIAHLPANEPIFWTEFFNRIFQHFALCTTYLHFALPYFALCAMGIVFACAIKTDKICIFCFKLVLNFVMLSAGLIWRCAAPIKFSALANLAVIWQNVH